MKKDKKILDSTERHPQHPASKEIFICRLGKQENAIHNHEKNKSLFLDSGITQMIELADKEKGNKYFQ